jgi:cell wall-associated NlpC family hydrolase
MRRRWTCIFVIALPLLSSACATTGATPRPFPTPHPPPPVTSADSPPPPVGSPPVRPVSGKAAAYGVTGTALTLRGTPYRNGGSDPAGFDCSGFVFYVFGQNGFIVPRTVGELFRAGKEVDPPELEPGDLVFFTTVAPGASYVGIVIGGDEFVHAPSSVGQVRVERLSSSYWSPRFVGARRVL